MSTTVNEIGRTIERSIISGSSVEAIAGAAAVVLAILGLAAIEPAFMLTVATIALGAALVAEAVGVSAEYARVLSRSSDRSSLHRLELGGGMGMQFAGGSAAIVLGILGLIGLVPTTLIAIAAIVLGVALAANSGVMVRLNALRAEPAGNHEMARRVAYEAMNAVSGTEVLVGLGAIVLGILALIGLASQTLELVAVLALGAAVVMTGSALIGKMLSVFAR